MEIKKIIDRGELNYLKEKVNNGFDLAILLEDDSTILHYAAKQGQDDIISYLLDHGLDIEAKSKEQVRPLQMAVDAESISTVKLLLNRGANIYARSKNNYQVIHISCFYNHAEILQYLIDHGADVNAKFDRGGSALNIAIEYGNLRMVELLISNGADVNNTDETLFTPLYYAVKYNQGDIFKLLINHGADTTQLLSDEMSLLMYCVKKGSDNCVKPLIETGYNYQQEVNSESPLHIGAIEGYGYVLEMAAKAGIDINFKDSNGKTMLDYCFEHDNSFAAKTLIKQGATIPNEQLVAAAKLGHYESLAAVANNQPDTIFNDGSSLLHLLIEEGESELLKTVLKKSTKTINIQNKKGNTALHIATYAYDQTAIKLLIEAGADLYLLNKVGENVLNTINPDMSCESVLYFKNATKLFLQKSQYNETPIEAILRKGYFKSMPAFIQIYYEMGDDTIYKYGFTVLQMAAALGIGNAMEVLTKSGNLHFINEEGENLLAFAIKLEPYNKEFSYTQRLLDAGLNLNTPNKEGNTLLHICAKGGKSWAIDALLKGGAKADILDKRGRTALHYVAESGFHYLISSLLKYGATPSIKDNEGITPQELGEAYSDEIANMFINC